ncbi:MAG: polysaccharide deacetylase family protein [Kiritimatiellia bacterium]|nr:polysaccharide deacetylase family protein [Kiritimatiellia bacterium]
MNPRDPDSTFDVVFGFDMETDIGSFTPFYEGVRHGTPRLLSILKKQGIQATFFWTGHAADTCPSMVRKVRDAGHETGCHGLYHETLGDAVFPLPNNWPVLPDEVEGRIREGSKRVLKAAGVQPVSFRCPRLWGSTRVLQILEKLGYVADASLPLYFYRKQIVPYHPSARDWTQTGKMKILEIPNFCDLKMKSKDPYQRDRDQWPLFRTHSANRLEKSIHSFLGTVRRKGHRPVLCFYFHPWEFHPMPKGALDFGEARVIPQSFIVKNCGPYACEQFTRLCILLRDKGARFLTCRQLANDY